MYEEDAEELAASGRDENEHVTEEALARRRRARIEGMAPEVREVFAQKRRELLEKYPDFYTKPIENGPVVSLSTKLDFAVVFMVVGALAMVLYFQEGINVFALLLRLIERALDPGLPPPRET